MNLKTAASLLLATVAIAANQLQVLAATGADYITAAPATIYEASTPSPQNMDFDKEKNMFLAHAGWYNNRLVHYYKFRIYAPGTYDGLIDASSGPDDVPLQKVYMMTTTGGFDGVVGKPVLEFHTSDGNSYSDFMVINFVTVDGTYTENKFKSVGDITAGGNTVTESSIVLNLPIVPTGSTLQSPEDKTMMAPIKPIKAFYKGVEVQTFVFEVNDQSAFDYFNPISRDDPSNADYKIPVVTTFASKDAVTAIPLWHVNQFTRGVSAEKGNQGGPSDAGMRNIINLDRPDPGYSPLWHIFWVTALPIDYMADQISHSNDLKTDNGVEIFAAPMFINCPDIGPVGSSDNPDRMESHDLKLDLAQTSNFVLGSDSSLVLQAEKPVKIVTEDGTVVAEGMTNMMGAYEIEVMSSKVPSGTTKLKVMSGESKIRELEVEDTSSGAMSVGAVGMMSAAAMSLTLMVGVVM